MQLIADHLTCVRGGREVFADLSFSLSAGEALVITGRNGAGKSSLLRLAAGLLGAAGGYIGLKNASNDLSLAEQAHYLGHVDPHKATLSVAENLRFWTDYLSGRAGKNALKNALAAVGLGALANLPAGYLSAGQKRRLSLARLAAVKRPVWLLDEPTAALDGAAQKQLAALMNAHLRGGGIILAASHGPIGLNRTRRIRLGA